MTSIKITYPEELLAKRVKELEQSLTTCLTLLTRAWDDISSLQQEVLDLRAKITEAGGYGQSAAPAAPLKGQDK